MSKIVCAAFVTMCCLLQALASAQSTTGSSSMPYIPNTRVRPFPYLQSSNYALLGGAAISVEFGFVAGKDQLILDYQGEYDIKTNYDADRGVLWLSGEAPTSVYMSAISSVIFYTQSDDGQQRRITWNFGLSTLYSSLTGHYYQFVDHGVAWSTANATCASSKMFNLQGYLATITSANEMASVGGKVAYSTFIGAHDADAEGTWKWSSGPLAGTQFWSGKNQFNGGVPTNNMFSAWARFQPNNGGAASNPVENFLALQPGIPGVGYFKDYIANGLGYLCEYGGMDSDDVAATTGEFANSVVLGFSCSMIEDAGECTNNAQYGCAYSGVSCIQLQCMTHPEEKACMADWRCEWAMDGDIGKCGNTRCGKYSNADACAADDQCTSSSTASGDVCKPATCSDKTTASKCAVLSSCQFVQSQCMSQYSYGCANVDTVFMLDGSASMAAPWGKASTGFQGLVDTLRMFPFSINGLSGQKLGFVQYGPDSMLETSSQVASGAANTLRYKPSNVAADLESMQNSFVVAPGTRQISSALSAAVAMLKSETSTTRKKVIVIFASGAISDAAAIKAAGTLPSDVVVLGYAIKPSNQVTNEGTAAKNSLMYLSGSNTWEMSLGDVSQAISNQCNGVSASSMAINPTGWPAVVTCFSHWTKATCITDPNCGFDDASSTCKPTACAGNARASDCTGSCAWMNNMCVQKCASQATQIACNAQSTYCMWSATASACVDMPCIGSPTEDSCIASSAACKWKAPETAKVSPFAVTPGRCTLMSCEAITSSASCNSGCTWLTSQKCVEDVCGPMTTKTSCESKDAPTNSQCQWGNGACTLNTCGTLTTEKDCGDSVQCSWSVDTAPGLCKPAMCTGLNLNTVTRQSACQALESTLQCTWNSETLCSLTTCAMLSASDTCARRTDCVWRDNQCKDVRFVQCPGIDVIVAVEATTMMGQAFGRHPNGFMGIIEKLREWGNELPFSNSAIATGFRIQLQLYGSKSAQSYPSDSTFYYDDGGNTPWTGAGSYLHQAREYYSVASNLPAGNEVHLVGALKTAFTTFKNNAAAGANRRKVMVILGNSAVSSDSATDLNATVSLLESQGVQVFSSLVQRFSTITSTEQAAAARLAPFSSDPRSTHFSFTSIDQLRPMFFDDFCDPTTSLGQSIQVSRSDTLPCPWLAGKTECEVQGGCSYDRTAKVMCTLPGQCPQLGCIALPDSIANVFECKHCELVNGAFKCSTGNSFPEPTGLCMTDVCMTNSSTTCSSHSRCDWDSTQMKCTRKQCGYSFRDSCNADAACVYVDPTLDVPGGGGAKTTVGACRKSTCGLIRDSATCSGMMVAMTGSSSYHQCYFDKVSSPAICYESRCTNSDQSNCLAGCSYKATPGSRSCYIQVCRHATQARCQMDTGCYWNPDKDSVTEHKCQPRNGQCQLADHYSAWSTCSSSCAGGIRYKVREIYDSATEGNTACSTLAGQPSSAVGTAPNTKLVEVQTCNSVSPLPCAQYCPAITTPGACAGDISCMWAQTAGMTMPGCIPRTNNSCGGITAKADCDAADGCQYDNTYLFCFPGVSKCKTGAATADTCANFQVCQWNSGARNNMDAAAMGATSHLVNPGQKAILLFPTVRFESDTVITGATVTIEGNYSRGSDMLEVSYGRTLVGSFKPAAGTLFISGSATVTEYANAIRAVTFFTTSTSTATRTVTWTLGHDMVYSSVTGHYYKAFNATVGMSYATAVSRCNAEGDMWGKFGYLVAIDSEHENDVVTSKLDAMGWISGEDRTQGQWRLTTGPSANAPFWSGGPYFAGGRPAAGRYANWATDSPNSSSTSFSNAYLSETGFWVTKSTDEMGMGFICEFGGMSNDIVFDSFPTHGVTAVSGGGCIPRSCVFHTGKDGCERDIECMWHAETSTTGLCKVGCAGFASAGACASATHCKWDDKTLPASCALDVCQKASQIECSGALTNTCLWSAAQGCLYRSGCAVHVSSADCSTVEQCTWTPSGVAGVPAFCATKPCDLFTTSTSCALNAQCDWNTNTGSCVSTVCKTGDENVCKSDRRCTWQDGMSGAAVAFTPGGSSVLPFAKGIPRTDDISTMCSGITVSIVQGFQQGSDMLLVRSEDNIASNFVVSYDRLSGVLIARTSPGVTMTRYGCYQFLQVAVRFFTTSNTINSRRLSYTLGADMVVNQNNTKLLQYVKQTAMNFTAATAVCAAQAMSWGYTGARVARITSQVDNLRLRALGAQGWLSATVQPSSQQWYWPGSSANFWSGAGASGKVQNGGYAQWAGGEPLGATAETSRAFLVSSGFWKVITGGANTPSGVICEFDTPATIVTSSRNAAPFGCFLSACLGYGFDVCRQDPQCVWRDAVNGSQTAGQCAMDTWCTAEKAPSSCANRELCYWDYDLSTCRTAPASKCSAKSTDTSCSGAIGCTWKSTAVDKVLPRSSSQSGVCVFGGCAGHPASSPCSADPECRWASTSLISACVPRLCGYLSETQCWSDKMCVWDMLVSRCAASSCTQYAPNDPMCSSANSCAKSTVNNAEICGYVRCGTTLGGSAGKDKCQDDSSCLWNPDASSCASAGCDQHIQEKSCNADAKCYFTYNPNRCLAAQCTSNSDLQDCEKGEVETAMKPCIWDQTTASCRQPTFAEQNAPASSSGVCEKEEYGNLAWLWVLAVLILILIIAIFYRLYLAYKHGLSFFEPARNTKSFSPHSNVGADVFEEAQRFGEETNVNANPQYSRPTADEL